jgi:hypothetical protein
MLSLLEDHTVTLYDNFVQDGGKWRTIVGDWKFNGLTNQYVIAIDGKVSVYRLVKPEDENICILANGDLNATNLSESWFAATADEYPDDTPPERE